MYHTRTQNERVACVIFVSRTDRVCNEKAPRRWPIFPLRRRSSIVSAEAFHYRVRDGNGWVRLALTTKGLCSPNSMLRDGPDSKGRAGQSGAPLLQEDRPDDGSPGLFFNSEVLP